MVPSLEFEEVAFSYRAGRRPALSGLSFRVAPGECIALFGTNGSGKTTASKLAAGWLLPTGGHIQSVGVPAESVEARAQTLYLADEPLVPAGATLGEAISVCARLNGLSPGEMEKRVALAAERLGLAVESEAYLDELSRGQRRKVALALGFALERRLMILDEPTEALDESGRRALAQLCIERMEWGGSLLVASHDKTFLGAAQAHCLDLTSACA